MRTPNWLELTSEERGRIEDELAGRESNWETEEEPLEDDYSENSMP